MYDLEQCVCTKILVIIARKREKCDQFGLVLSNVDASCAVELSLHQTNSHMESVGSLQRRSVSVD